MPVINSTYAAGVFPVPTIILILWVRVVLSMSFIEGMAGLHFNPLHLLSLVLRVKKCCKGVYVFTTNASDSFSVLGILGSRRGTLTCVEEIVVSSTVALSSCARLNVSELTLRLNLMIFLVFNEHFYAGFIVFPH